MTTGETVQTHPGLLEFAVADESLASRLDTIAASLEKGYIAHATVLIDESHGPGRVTSIVFDMLDAQGNLSRITGADPRNIGKRLGCPQLDMLDANSTPENWQDALNRASSGNKKFGNLPVSIHHKGQSPHRDQHTKSYTADPKEIVTEEQRKIMQRVLSQSEQPMVIEITSRDMAMICFGQSQSINMRLSALTLGLGMAGLNIIKLSPLDFARKLATCTFKGKRIPLLLKSQGVIVFPSYVTTTNTEKLIRQNQIDAAWDGFDPAKVQEALKQAEQRAIKRDIDVANESDDGTEFEPEYKGVNSYTGAHTYDDGSVAGVDKRTPNEMRRWETRNIDKSRKDVPDYQYSEGWRKKKGMKPVQKNKRHYNQDDKSNRYHRNSTIGQLKIYHANRNAHPSHRELTPWGPRMEVPSRLERYVDNWLADAKRREENKTHRKKENEIAMELRGFARQEKPTSVVQKKPKQPYVYGRTIGVPGSGYRLATSGDGSRRMARGRR